MTLPKRFCWTRFGTEAGQTIEHILARKERERIANGGLFFWGIGNAIGEALRELLRSCSKPEVLFSPIKSRPRPEDVLPPAVAAWMLGETLDGNPFRLPAGSIVTSRYDPLAPPKVHYALVCYSQERLCLSQSEEKIEFGELRNLLSNQPMGSSQVTAVVKRNKCDFATSRVYDIAMRAELAYPYFVRLRHPLPLQTECSVHHNDNWETAVEQFIERQISNFKLEPTQGRLWER